ncbi:DUF4192 family protein [Pseudonocardia phyllosphaerae]|uniref:DUF4192 family protein n=1 Tax=Pseudonocardia phyllosphaerae TaxID=3390502 RepID=UPI003979B177
MTSSFSSEPAPPDPTGPDPRLAAHPLRRRGPDGLPGVPWPPPDDSRPQPGRPAGPAPGSAEPGPPVSGSSWAAEPDAPRIRITGSDDLLAAVPMILGFHPENSLVLVGTAGADQRGKVGLTVRVDLPPPAQVRRVCADAVSALAGDGPERAIAIVVRKRGKATRPPRREVAATVRRALLDAGITPVAVLWAAGTHTGDEWQCYDLPGRHCDCHGTVPAPGPMAAAAALRGRAVLPDRAAVAAQLDGGPGDAERRARLRDSALPADPGGGAPPELLGDALRAAAEGTLTIDDDRARAFRDALDDADFRDDALRACLGDDAPHAEQLWAVLCRALPAPERADAAALLATTALLRGDGALATAAVDRARADLPGDLLSEVVALSLRTVVTPVAGIEDVAGPTGLRRLLETACELEAALNRMASARRIGLTDALALIAGVDEDDDLDDDPWDRDIWDGEFDDYFGDDDYADDALADARYDDLAACRRLAEEARAAGHDSTDDDTGDDHTGGITDGLGSR